MADCMRTHVVRGLWVSSLTMLSALPAFANGNIDPDDHWAWGTCVGWFNFALDHGRAAVHPDYLEEERDER